MSEKFTSDLSVLIRSRHAIVLVETYEHDHVDHLLSHVAMKLSIPYFVWNRSKGIRLSTSDTSSYATQNCELALKFIESSKQEAIYHFHGFGAIDTDPSLAATLAEASRFFTTNLGAIIISDANFKAPASLKAHISTIPWPKPEVSDYKKVYFSVLMDLAERLPIKNDLRAEGADRLVANLKGLSLSEARRVLMKVIVDDNRLTEEDLLRVLESKKDFLMNEELLEFIPSEDLGREMAGLDGLRRWLKKRKDIIKFPGKAKEFNLDFPKGILLLGVQGCGKSMCAKSVAQEWGLPLLKMDPSRLFDKYIGESEKNATKAFRTAESMSPVVLWIDEIEKVFSSSGGETDGGTSQRFLGLFLNWLQERKGDVFIVATANDIQKLPPELIRKGRFDEIFFVDLPDEDTRKEIFRIHIKNRKLDPAHFDINQLAGLAQGFSGAEIEQSIISALYTVISERKSLSTLDIKKEIELTRPLSRIMGEKIERLRSWAADRTVSAH